LVHGASENGKLGTTVVILVVPDEASLLDLSDKLSDIPHVCFREPDLSDELTCISINPIREDSPVVRWVRKLTRGLPLFMEEKNNGTRRTSKKSMEEVGQDERELCGKGNG